VLLKRQHDVVEQGAVRGKKLNGDFKRLAVPELALLLLLVYSKIGKRICLFFQLNYKPQLSAKTEIADYEVGY
jgi:hypothetical protein